DALPIYAARGAAGGRPHDRGDQYEVTDRELVELGGVGDTGQGGRNRVDVQRQALLTAGEAAGVAFHPDGAGLREGERHHGEADTAQREGTQGDRAEEDGGAGAEDEGEQGGGHQAEYEIGHGEPRAGR